MRLVYVSNDDHIDWLQWGAYFDGTCSAAERAILERWIDAAPERRVIAEKLRVLWDVRKQQASVPYDHDAFRSAVLHSAMLRAERTDTLQDKLTTLRRPPVGPTRLSGTIPSRRVLLRWGAGAVAAAVIAAIGITVANGPAERASNATAGETIRTVAGQRKIVHLADGSKMTLAPATTAQITPGAVAISGEAYFEVAPQTRHPFTLRTTNALVHVLGTTFTVRRYPDESTSRVVVETGRVTVQLLRGDRAGLARAVLSARMMAQVGDSGVSMRSDVTTQQYLGWTQGLLVFDSVALRDVVTELSRAYGARILVADSTLAARTVLLEVSLDRNQLGEVLDVIGEVMGAHYTRDGQAYVVAPGRASSRGHRPLPTRYSYPQPERQYGK